MEAKADGGIFVMFTVDKPGAERATGEGFGGGDEKEAGAMIDESLDGHASALHKKRRKR